MYVHTLSYPLLAKLGHVHVDNRRQLQQVLEFLYPMEARIHICIITDKQLYMVCISQCGTQVMS